MSSYSNLASVEGEECVRPSSTVGIEFSKVEVYGTIGIKVEFAKKN